MADFDDIIQEINTNIPDNNTQAITAKKLRDTLTDLIGEIETQQNEFEGEVEQQISDIDVDFQSGQALPSVSIVNDLTTGGADNVLSANQGKVLNEKYKYPYLNVEVLSGYLDTRGTESTLVRNPSTTLSSVIIKVSEGDKIRIYGKGSTSTWYKLYAFYGNVQENGKYPRIYVYDGTNLDFRNTPLDVTIPSGVSYMAVNLLQFDASVDCVLKFSLNKAVDIDVINDKLNELDATSTTNKYKLIELVAWGSSFTLELGEYGYKTTTKTIRHHISNTAQGEGVFINVPYEHGAIYRYRGTLYYWDYTNENMVSIDGISNLAQLSDVQILNPSNGQSLVYDETTQKWINANNGDSVVDNLFSNSSTSALSAKQGKILYEDNFSDEGVIFYPNKYIPLNYTTVNMITQNSTTLSSFYTFVEEGDVVRIYGYASTYNYYNFYAMCADLNSEHKYPIVSKYSGQNNYSYRDTPLELIIPAGISLLIVNCLNYDPATDKVIVYRKGENKTKYNRISNGAYGKYYVSSQINPYFTTCDSLYAAYDALMAEYPNYITKTKLGEVSFTISEVSYTYDINEYVFTNGNFNKAGTRGTRDAEIAKPIVGIITGVHGNERSTVNGMYYILRDMLHNTSPLSPIYDNLELHIVPIACPYGFQYNSRTNHNSVNINRNFATSGWVESGQGTQDWTGSTAASETETQILQTWIQQLHLNGAKLIIDWHNSGFSNEISCLASSTNNTEIEKIKKQYLLSTTALVPILINELGANKDSIWAYTSRDATEGMTSKYMTQQGQNGCYFETSYRVNYPKSYTYHDANAGATVIGNLLIDMADYMNKQ